VGVARVQEPLLVGPRASLDHLADELFAQAAAAELGEDVDVRQIDDRDAVREGAGEADLAPVGVEADDAARLPILVGSSSSSMPSPRSRRTARNLA
jgi:hypothetical protein